MRGLMANDQYTQDSVLLAEQRDDGIAVLTMNRGPKRNAMNDDLLAEIGKYFAAPPKDVRVVVLRGTEGHYCSGLDLSEHKHRNAEETLYHSRGWHKVMDDIQFGGLPVVSAMFGAVIGGGLELALSTHVRIAEPSTMFQLPEGRRGIFVGGGATVRAGRILGPDRVTEMMLTGRKYGSEEGLALGLTHYSVGEGEAFNLALELAGKIARNAPLSNYLMIQSLAEVGDMPRRAGLYAESLSAALAQTTSDAEEGLKAFLEKRSPSFR